MRKHLGSGTDAEGIIKRNRQTESVWDLERSAEGIIERNRRTQNVRGPEEITISRTEYRI